MIFFFSEIFNNKRSFLNIKAMRFLLALFTFECDVISVCLWSNFL